MAGEQERYEKLIRILKRSVPEISDPDGFYDNIFRRIQKDRTEISFRERVYEFVFGWVYIGWMRRIMVTAALAIVVFLGIEQAITIKRINNLSGQIYVNNGSVRTTLPEDFSNKMRLIRLYGSKAAESKIPVSEKDIDRFIESVNDLQTRYKDVLEIINSDPELKKYYEEKINKTSQAKPKM
jgi:hypothetical protein